MLVNYPNLNKIKEEEFTSIQEGYKNVWPWERKVDSPSEWPTYDYCVKPMK